MPQQLILQPLGIVTQPGKLTSLPPGAMSQADNVYIRSPFKIERAKPWATSATHATAGTALRSWMLPSGSVDWSLLLNEVTANVWAANWNSPQLGGYYPGPSLVNEAGVAFQPRADGSVWAVEANGFQYGNMDCGVACFERSVDPATSSAPLSSAGIRSPLSTAATATALTVTGGAVPWGHAAGYTAIIRRVSPSGTEYVSAPCSAAFVQFSQVNEATFPSASIGAFVWFHSTWARVGDRVEFYRTRTQEWIKNAAYISPGSDYFRVTTVKLTSTDITNGFVSINDNTSNEALGDALYTNDGFQGAEGLTYPPPTAACMAQFKGYTFYANIKQPASISLRPINGWTVVGDSATGAAPKYLFGMRNIAVNQTSGSGTVTPVNTNALAALVVGMKVNGSGFTGAAFITAVGGSTFTVSPAPSSTISNNPIEIVDVIEINGAKFDAGKSSDFGLELKAGGETDFRVYGLDSMSPPMPAAFRADALSVPLVTIRNEKQAGARNAMPTFTIRATHGALLDPPLPSIEFSETAITVSPVEQKDGWACSEQHEPWRVPLGNYEQIGAGSTIIALAPMKDSMLFFTTKGVKRLSGSGGSAGDGFDWRLDPVDDTLVLTGPRAWCVLRDVCYARTSRGVVSITADGNVMPISEGIIGDVFPGRIIAPNIPYVSGTSTCVWMVADEANGEVLLFDFTVVASSSIYRYNIVTKTWVTDSPGISGVHHGAYFPFDAMVCVYFNGAAVTPSINSPVVGTPGTWPVSKVHFQPICGDNAFAQKHWQGVDPLILCSGTLTIANLYVNGTSWYASTALNSEGTINANRAEFEVPRDAPADAPTITVGMDIAASAQTFEMIGVAVSFETIAFDRIVR
jgi:hypothetical protein